MNFILKPSLEHMSLVKIGISLWNQNDVRALISVLSSDDLYPSKWKKIEERVIEKVSQLSLPQLLKEKVFGVVKPIGLQILEWMQYYRECDDIEFKCHLDLDLPAPLPTELCWTPQGTVDRKKTAEMLVKNESLDVFTRYKLACEHCLKDDIARFWDKLPKNIKDYDWYYFPEIDNWSDNMKRGGANEISYKDTFYSSAISGNKVAAKYFLQKLTPQEREESLEELAKDIDTIERNTDVLCFLLPELEKEQQMLVLKSDPCGVLKYFLRWPFQGFFIEIANYMWDFLPYYEYDHVLGVIIGKVSDGYKDCNYKELFREFWQKSPSTLKDAVIEEIDKSCIKLLFAIRDKENIRLILKNVPLTAKVKLIYSDTIFFYLTCSIHENEWDFLKFCIRECLPSKKEILNFKKEFKKCMYFNECSSKEKYKWNQLFHFDDSICKYGKRRIEGENSSCKRFQSL